VPVSSLAGWLPASACLSSVAGDDREDGCAGQAAAGDGEWAVSAKERGSTGSEGQHESLVAVAQPGTAQLPASAAACGHSLCTCRGPHTYPDLTAALGTLLHRPLSADPDLPEPAQQPAAPQRVHPRRDAALPVPHTRGGAAGAAGALGWVGLAGRVGWHVGGLS